jgi:hypothetical protein
MKDKDFEALQLRASLCPGLETDWDAPETMHWIALRKAARRAAQHGEPRPRFDGCGRRRQRPRA